MTCSVSRKVIARPRFSGLILGVNAEKVIAEIAITAIGTNQPRSAKSWGIGKVDSTNKVPADRRLFTISQNQEKQPWVQLMHFQWTQNEMTRRPNSRIAFTTSPMAREYLPVKDYLSSIPPRENN